MFKHKIVALLVSLIKRTSTHCAEIAARELHSDIDRRNADQLELHDIILRNGCDGYNEGKAPNEQPNEVVEDANLSIDDKKVETPASEPKKKVKKETAKKVKKKTTKTTGKRRRKSARLSSQTTIPQSLAAAAARGQNNLKRKRELSPSPPSGKRQALPKPAKPQRKPKEGMSKEKRMCVCVLFVCVSEFVY